MDLDEKERKVKEMSEKVSAFLQDYRECSEVFMGILCRSICLEAAFLEDGDEVIRHVLRHIQNLYSIHRTHFLRQNRLKKGNKELLEKSSLVLERVYDVGDHELELCADILFTSLGHCLHMAEMQPEDVKLALQEFLIRYHGNCEEEKGEPI